MREECKKRPETKGDPGAPGAPAPATPLPPASCGKTQGTAVPAGRRAQRMGFTPKVLGSFLPVRTTALPSVTSLAGSEESLSYALFPRAGVWPPPSPRLDPDGILTLFLGAGDGKEPLAGSGRDRPFVWANQTGVGITEKGSHQDGRVQTLSVLVCFLLLDETLTEINSGEKGFIWLALPHLCPVFEGRQAGTRRQAPERRTRRSAACSLARPPRLPRLPFLCAPVLLALAQRWALLRYR